MPGGRIFRGGARKSLPTRPSHAPAGRQCAAYSAAHPRSPSPSRCPTSFSSSACLAAGVPPLPPLPSPCDVCPPLPPVPFSPFSRPSPSPSVPLLQALRASGVSRSPASLLHRPCFRHSSSPHTFFGDPAPFAPTLCRAFSPAVRDFYRRFRALPSTVD